MGKEISTFSDIEIEKNNFYHYESPTLMQILSEKVLVSSKIFSVEKNHKCFIDYFHNDHKFKPLCIMLPKTRAYVNSYDVQTNWMHFLIKDDDVLEK